MIDAICTARQQIFHIISYSKIQEVRFNLTIIRLNTMEGHEIPKNVSEFEFHLVGDMTLKQFAYLASGLGAAYFVFVSFASSLPLIAWPLIFIFSAAGIAYAFLPISDRPLDHWTINFFRAIFTPTQRVWKTSFATKDSSIFSDRLSTYLNYTSNTLPTSSAIATKSSVISRFVSTPQPLEQPKAQSPKTPTPAPPIPTPPVSNLPTNKELEASVGLAKEAVVLQNQITQTEKVLSSLKAKVATPGTSPILYSNQLKQTQDQLTQLKGQAQNISHELAVLSRTPTIKEPKKPVKISQTAFSPDIKLILTSVPNIINGIVTDTQGNYLESVVVVTHDKDGLPVRALKTNKLGQFLAATPLPNGVYTITLEKDGLNFDTFEIALEDQVIPPINISAKKGGVL